MSLFWPTMAMLLRVFCVALLLFVAAHRSPAAEVVAKKKKPPVSVSRARGFCDEPIRLELKFTNSDAVVRFTLDGTEPTPANGATYTDALLITNTTLLREAAFKADARVSAITTHSYIFLQRVLRQPNE